MKTSLSLKIIVTGFSLAALSSCGSSVSSLSDNSAPELVGTWFGECKNYLDEGDGSYSSDQVEFVISTDIASIYMKSYSGKDCAAANAWHLQSASSTYTTSLNTTQGNGIKNIDLEVTRVTFMPQTANEALAHNTEKTCGFDQWQEDVEVDLLDLPCDKEDQPISRGQRAYDIWLVSDGGVQFGLNPRERNPDSDIGRSPETRPASLTAKKYMKRQ